MSPRLPIQPQGALNSSAVSPGRESQPHSLRPQHNPVLSLLSRTAQGPQHLPHSSQHSTAPAPSLPKPATPICAPPGQRGLRLRLGWFCASRMDSDPTRVQSSGSLPCTAPVWSWCSPWHGDDGIWRRSPSTPGRIPPPLALSPPGQSPGDATLLGPPVGRAASLSPAAGGSGRAAAQPSLHPQTGRQVEFPPSSPQQNADAQLAAAPLPLAGCPARPAEPPRVRGTDTLPSPALLGRHSSSPRFYIK